MSEHHATSSTPTATIFIVDDDPELRVLIGGFLRQHGYDVTEHASAADFWQAFATKVPDLVVLDVMMPNESGLSVAKQLAQHRNSPRVIMLSAMDGDVDRIVGLEVGADDYLAKPCNPRELLARIRAQLRRREENPALVSLDKDEYEFASWRMNIHRRTLREPGGGLVLLSEGEFALLKAFAEHPQRVLSRDQLLDMAHGTSSEVYDRAIDSQISRLRRKLADYSADPMINTVRNVGYQFVPAVRKP